MIILLDGKMYKLELIYDEDRHKVVTGLVAGMALSILHAESCYEVSKCKGSCIILKSRNKQIIENNHFNISQFGIKSNIIGPNEKRTTKRIRKTHN